MLGSIFRSIKRKLFFLVAGYFRFWASLKLKRWSPKIIVVTGSAGKTTLLHLIEAQLGSEAHYSHHANSAYGIPFDILGMTGVRKSRLDWIGLILKTPFKAFTKPYTEKLYVAEVDADRPKEGAFLAKLLKPDVTLWVSSLHTHATSFDALVSAGKFKTTEEAIAFEYGNLLAVTKELVVQNGDSELMHAQLPRTKAKVEEVFASSLNSYKTQHAQTTFEFENKTFTIPALVPKATFYQVAMVQKLLEYLNHEPDANFSKFVLPPGRSNVFEGIKGTTLIDSTYNNSNFDSLREIVEMFELYEAGKKWAVIGDILDQGKDESSVHQKIASLLENTHFERIILFGPRVIEYTLPLLSEELKNRTVITSFDKPVDVLKYLQANLSGGEAVAFKGVRFLEGVIQKLLKNPEDAALLPRRDPVWQKYLKEWGL